MGVNLDDSDWSLLLISLGELNVEGFDAFISWYESALRRAADEGVTMVTVAMASGPPPSAELTRHISTWLRRLSDEQHARCSLSVVVIDNALVRRAITALNWFRRPITHQVVVEDHDAAYAAVVAHFYSMGRAPPPRPWWLTTP